MTSIGIDPGKKGAICINLDVDIYFYKIPYTKDNKLNIPWLRHLSGLNPDLVLIEEPFIMSGNKNKGLTTQLKEFGMLYGASEMIFGDDKVKTCTPRQWKSHLGVGSGKEASIAKAKELFPEIGLRFSSRCKKDDDNMAEALLLTVYARHILKI